MRYIVFVLVLALAACASQKPAAKAPAPIGTDPYANGRRIFMTGRDLQGNAVTAVPQPMRSSCMQCHRANGSGGVHIGGAVSADLRHNALVNQQKHPYAVASLERAISTGVDNEGQKLDPVMPRWRMSKADLHDLAVYVYQALK